jgi:aspartate racemase
VALEMAQQLIRLGEAVGLLVMFDTYNHDGRAPALSLLQKLIFQKEKFLFHLANVKNVSLREKVAYLRDKYQGAWERERHKLAATVFKRLGRAGAWNSALNLEKINDRAGFAYRPQPYPGKLTLFKFHRNFSCLEEPQYLGWKKVCGGLEVIELEINPGGMFVQPYVQQLAEKLKPCLQQAQSGTS